MYDYDCMYVYIIVSILSWYIYIVICRIRLFEFVSMNIHMHFCMHPQFSCAIGIYHAQVGRVLFFCLPTPRHGSMARNWWVFKNDPKRLGWNCWIFSWNWAFSPWAVLRLCSSTYVLSCQGMWLSPIPWGHLADVIKVFVFWVWTLHEQRTRFLWC